MDGYAVRLAALGVAAEVHQGRETPVPVLTAYAELLVAWLGAVGGGAASMVLSLRGDPMPLNVDSVNAKAVLAFEDDHGDAVPPPPGTRAVASSSDAGVLGVGDGEDGADSGGVTVIDFPLTAVSAGTCTLSVTVTGPDGGPLLGPDGVTPIPPAAPVEVTVNPGAAAAERFSVPDA